MPVLHQYEKTLIVGLIPARGGSKGIPRKNLAKINGVNLVNRSVDFCRSSGHVDYVVVSSDSSEILQSTDEQVIRIERPAELAADDAPIELSFIHALSELKIQGIRPDIFVWLQPNIPVRTSGIVDRVLEALMTDSEASAAATCFAFDQRIQWGKKVDKTGYLIPIFPARTRYRRQDLELLYLLDGSVSAFRVENLSHLTLEVHSYLGGNIIPVVQKDSINSLELDEIEDLQTLYRWLEQEDCDVESLSDYFEIN